MTTKNYIWHYHYIDTLLSSQTSPRNTLDQPKPASQNLIPGATTSRKQLIQLISVARPVQTAAPLS